MCGPNPIIAPILLVVLLLTHRPRDLVLVDGRYWRSVERKPWWRRCR